MDIEQVKREFQEKWEEVGRDLLAVQEFLGEEPDQHSLVEGVLDSRGHEFSPEVRKFLAGCTIPEISQLVGFLGA